MLGINMFKSLTFLAVYNTLNISLNASTELGAELTLVAFAPLNNVFNKVHILSKIYLRILVFLFSTLNLPLFMAYVLNSSAINSSKIFL